MTRLQLDRLLEQTVADALGVRLEASRAHSPPARRVPGTGHVASAKPSKRTHERRHLEHA